MSKSSSSIPIFALDASADWEDLENALEASVQYQTRVAGKFGPVFAFAPLTAPTNPDGWEPLATPPDFLLLASIERSRDAFLLQAFRRSERQIGPLLRESTASVVKIAWDQPIADVFRQMENSAVRAFASLGLLQNDLSRFFVRGSRAILALHAAMQGA